MAKLSNARTRAPAVPARRRPAAARRPSVDPSRLTSGELWEGHVLAVEGEGGAGVLRARLGGGELVRAFCPAHVDARWIAAAAAVAPLPAVFMAARPSGRLVLFGVFPDRVHAEVRADVVIRGREIRLEGEGNVTVRGRDVTSHARRVNRIKGGAIRLN